MIEHRDIAALELARELHNLRNGTKLSWRKIAGLYPQYSEKSLKKIYYEFKKAPTPVIEGVTTDEPPEEVEVWRQAVLSSEKRKELERRKQTQVITFARGPICIVNFADLHAGSEGTDYKRIAQELTIINETPGMYSGFAGDLSDNFVIGRLAKKALHRRFTIDDEAVLLKKILTMAAPKMLWSLRGNHDAWTDILSGIDYFREVHQQKEIKVLYDEYEINVDIYVGASKSRWRIRHKWRGSSQYSDTHGIEKAAKFDKGIHFDVGIGAHTHRAGLSRFFNNGGQSGLAVLCGAYKRFDEFGREQGFSQPNEVTCVPVVLTESGGKITFDRLDDAVDYMKRVYPNN